MQLMFCIIYNIVLATGPVASTSPSTSSEMPGGSSWGRLPGQLTGQLVDSLSGQPVPFCAVALFDANSRQVMGGIADEEGRFQFQNLAPGTYRLMVTSVGYRSRNVVNLRIGTEGTFLDVGTLFLRPDEQVLNEVVVTGQRALIEDRGDRLVYNADRDISNQAGSAADVLRKVPMLSVDLNGNVQLRGSSNFRIFLNGKPSAMMARNPADALRQLPGGTIRSVEVITSPGARYDAEGTSGIINIITTKRLDGLHGSTYSTVGNLYQSLGSSVHYQDKKLGVSGTGGGSQFRSIGFQELYRTSLTNGEPATGFFQRNEQDNRGPGGNLGITVEYDPDSSSRFQFGMNGWGGKTPANNLLYSRLNSPDGQVFREFRQDIRQTDSYLSGEVNAGYSRSFSSRKRSTRYFALPELFSKTQGGPGGTSAGPAPEVTVLMQYSHTPYRTWYTSDQFTLEEQVTYREQSTNLSRFNELTFQSDYTYPLEFRPWGDTLRATLEVGVKGIRRDIGSDYSLEQAFNGSDNFQADPARSSQFDYLQQVLSGYFSVRLVRTRGWVLVAGSRLEHTYLGGDFISSDTTLRRQFKNLIPSLLLSRRFLDKHSVRLGYTQRIARPQIGYLNPFVNYSNPQNIVTGNPELDPELSHAFEISHSLYLGAGFFIHSSLFHRLTNNAIEYLSVVNTEGVAVSRPANIARRTVSGLQLSTTIKPDKNTNLTAGGGLQRLDAFSEALGQRNTGLVGTFTTSLSYRLVKDLIVQANGTYQTGRIVLQGRTSAWYGYAFSAKKDILEKKASLTLSVNTPFQRAVKQTTTREAPTFFSYANTSTVTRSVQATFYWQFGEYKSRGRQPKTITNDDKADSLPMRK
jgi:outer membrane receptor protein involved in Fe transport